MVFKGALRRFEQATGLPPLSEVAGAGSKIANVGKQIADKETLALYVQLLNAIPDKERMREINKFMGSLERQAKTAPDLQVVIQLFALVKELDFKEMNAALERLEALIKQGKKIGLDQILAEFAKQGG